METKKVRIAAVGDIHVSRQSAGVYKEYFTNISKDADILILAGDLTESGHVEEARVLAEELKSCTIPVLGVLGNHDWDRDHQNEIIQVLSDGNVEILEGESRVLEGIGFVGIKGFGGGFDNFMLSSFGEHHIKNYVREAAEEALQLDTTLDRLNEEKKVVIMHYSPISDTVVGEPEQIFPFLGCSRFAEPINRRGVSVVFHGHAHRGTIAGKTSKNIPVFNVAKTLLEQNGYPQGYLVYEV